MSTMSCLFSRLYYETLCYLSSKFVDETPILHLIPYSDDDVTTIFKDVMQLDIYPLRQRLIHFAVFMRWYRRRHGYDTTRWNTFYTSQLKHHTLVLPLVWLYVKVRVFDFWFRYLHR